MNDEVQRGDVATRFQKGNRKWEARAKAGRDMIFSTPAQLWQAAMEYFQWIEDNPLWKTEVVKGGDFAGTMYEVPVMRPLTLIGFCHFCDVNVGYLSQLEKKCKESDPLAFLPVIEKIKENIYEQKFEGAASGFFNAQFIGKAIGLVEKTMVGNDPDNPMPGLIQFYLPSNGREQVAKDKGEVDFTLD